MMKRMRAACVVAGWMVSGLVWGQTPASAPAAASTQVAGPAGEVQGNYARLKVNILKSADEMPAGDYTFKPTPDVRTFARVVNHVTEAQLHSCGAANHTAADALAKVPAETADKAAIVDALKASFGECDKAFAALTDGNLGEMLEAGKAKRSRVGLMWGTVSHDNEQYATLALYMRLKGLAPPSSEK
jgi:DinB superfamily